MYSCNAESAYNLLMQNTSSTIDRAAVKDFGWNGNASIGARLSLCIDDPAGGLAHCRLNQPEHSQVWGKSAWT